MNRQVLASVYVEKSVYSIDRPFDYLVPQHLADTLQRGCRVLVPFGKSNRKMQGLVVSLSDRSDFKGALKPISAQIDPQPVVSEEMFLLIDYLVRTTFCTFYEAVRVILPAGANVDVVECYTLRRRLDETETEGFTKEEQRLIEFLKTARTAKELNTFLDCRQNPAKSSVVKSLLKKGIIEKTDRLKPKASLKTLRLVRLASPDVQNVALTPKQQKIVHLLSQVGAATPKELAYLCGVTEGIVQTLLKKGVLTAFERECQTPVSTVSDPTGTQNIILSATQKKAYDGIRKMLFSDRSETALLHGVTGSGKTLLYIKLIDDVLKNGKTAILLVPEISLTPQLVARFRQIFGKIVAVIHSNLSLRERLEEDRRIRTGRVKIVIGTRSAVFAPLDNIGILILDEEGEASYKSESSPRYHARDVARYRCAYHKALLLLGSATPSIESYYHAQKGDYKLFSLKERYAAATLPDVFLIDMLAEQRENNISSLSKLLKEQLLQNYQAGEQSILLLNRRGYQSYATCMECGQVIKCPYCSVAMTYHKVNESLICHYCGHIEPFVRQCPSCKSEFIRLTGAGTQKIEDELSIILPQARVLRMDADTTSSRFAFEKKFGDFQKGKYDILLGTQMIAKGLDFPNVTLVGVLNADSGLYSGDYRSSERTFSLITQVVGRSGRSKKPGRAYIQTNDVQNPIFQFAADQDFEAFYSEEIQSRQALKYPPFCDMAMIGITGVDEEATSLAAHRAFAILREEATGKTGIAMKALGVSSAAIYKVSGKYRYRIIIKCRMNQAFRNVISTLLKRCGQEKTFAGISVFADINGDIN